MNKLTQWFKEEERKQLANEESIKQGAGRTEQNRDIDIK